MFRKITSAAAVALSFSSPSTRPRKPTPLTSRNSTSLLQMFRKISSAPADAPSFSSLASPLARPPKLTPLNSRNSTSLFTYAESSQDEPKIGVSTPRLRMFLQTNCKSGDVSADEAFGFFHRMVKMEPGSRLYSFNLLLNGLAKNERCYDVLSLYGKMNSVGLIPNFTTLNILLTSSCNANRVCDAFLVLGRILRKGYSPTIVTFNSLIKGLLIGHRVDDAVQLYGRLEKFGCRPDVITWRTMHHGLRLCRSIYTSNARALRTLREERFRRMDHYITRCQWNGVGYLFGTLFKKGKKDKAMELAIEMEEQESSPNMGVYDAILNAGKLKDPVRLLEVMVDREIHFDGKTFYALIDFLSFVGAMKELKSLLDWIIEYGIDLRSKPVDTYDGLTAGEKEEAN